MTVWCDDRNTTRTWLFGAFHDEVVNEDSDEGVGSSKDERSASLTC